MSTRDNILSNLDIKPADWVLEIGGGPMPFCRSDILADKYLEDNTERCGTLVVDRQGWEVIPETRSTSAKNGFEGMPLQKSTGKGLDLHVENFLDCIKTREKPNCDIEIGAHIARFSHFGNISYRLGRKVFWDSDKQEFQNDDEANRLVKANYRAPWELPKV